MRRELLVSLLLSVAVLTVYWGVWNHDFINLDDQDYVTQNSIVRSGMTIKGMLWALTTSHASNWFPLTWLSHMVDFELFGLNPGAHHAGSLLLHMANTLMLLFIFRRMSGEFWRSALVAALFALHPLHVESVAWAAERKDVLSTAFGLLTIWAYVRYVARPQPRRYLTVFLLFAAALMAKPMLVTLPFVLLLLDYWPLRRIGVSQTADTGASKSARSSPRGAGRTIAQLILEKLPLLGLSAASSITTFTVQHRWGAVSPMDELPLKLRIENSLISYVAYIRKLIWPADLSVFYPLQNHFPLQTVVGAGLLLVAFSVLAILSMRRLPFVLVGWYWYLGTLVPVMGLVQVGSQSMADRYTYIPLIGLFIIIAWIVPDCREFAGRRKLLLCGPLGAVLLALGVCTWIQARHWRNSITLFEHSLMVEPNDYLAHGCLGLALANEGKIDEAIAHYTEALRINPSFSVALSNLGVVLASKGRLEEAVSHYRRAIQLRPSSAEALNNLAWFLATAGKPEIRNGTEAVQFAERACELTDNSNPTMQDTLAAAYAEAARYHDAVGEEEHAIRLALSSGQGALAEDFQYRLGLYKAGHPYRESLVPPKR